jgi:hypothetical protein
MVDDRLSNPTVWALERDIHINFEEIVEVSAKNTNQLDSVLLEKWLASFFISVAAFF